MAVNRFEIARAVKKALEGVPMPRAGIPGSSGSPGPAGPAGADGADGQSVHAGSGAPSAGLGVVGDKYVDTANGDLWQKS